MAETEPTLETSNEAMRGPRAWLRAAGRFVTGLLAAPEPAAPAPMSRGEAAVMLAIAAAAGLWVFAFQMQRFLGLDTTSDLYVSVQLATTWLDGRFMQDNFFGNFLAIHTCFLCLPLAVFAYPFGAPGLLFALGLAVALSLVALVRILRLHGVGFRPALAFATVATVMPLSLHVYQNDYRAFDIDLLEPVLALWLADSLLRRHWAGALGTAVALILVKEDAPLLAVIVAAMIWCEDLIRRRRAWNGPAVAVILLSLAAVPLLLLVMKSQAGGVSALGKAGAAGAKGYGGLLPYVLDNLGAWLGSPVVALWLGLVTAGTFGLVWLRPHFLLIGVGTTLIAWLVRDSLLWAPRFAPSLAFLQVAGALGFASVCGLVRTYRGPGWFRRLAAVVLAVLGAVGLGWGLRQQWREVPVASEVYRFSPRLKMNPADRAQADRLFALYRREGRRHEPAMASGYLFRYAHDRNLLWPHTLEGRPRPTWILWDTEETPLLGLWVMLKMTAGIDLAEYELKGREGRFLLYRDRAGAHGGVTLLPEIPPVTGESHGALRMQVRFKAGRAGYYEPLVSIGPQNNGDVFIVHYLSERQLEIGAENLGMSARFSRPVDYEPGRTYELELFSGTLTRPVAEASGPEEEARLRYYQNLVSVRWNGEEILKTLALPRAIRMDEIHPGMNLAGSGSAGRAFTGRIAAIQRGGYPPMPEGGLGNFVYGAARMVLWPPASAAGVPEPLVVVGVPGRATLAYMRVLPGGRARFCVELWGFGAYEGEEVAAPSNTPAEIVVHFPALYPPVGDPGWGEVPPALQQARRSRVTILFNGTVVLDQEVPETGAPSAPVAFGENPVGGSLVTSKFSGLLIPGLRLRIDAP